MNRFYLCCTALFALLISPVALAEESAALSLKLASFNIRFPSEGDGPNQWEHRRELLFQTIREMDPDVMGVQEAFASQLKEIVAEIDGYAYVGVGRDDGKEDGEHAAVFYKKNRFEKLDGGTFWLSDTPHVVASNTWDAACNRVCSWVSLSDTASERQFAVYNAHYDHKSTKAREKSPVVIVEQIVAQGHEKHPLILMGDFNSSPSSPQMAYLLEGKARLDEEERKSPVLFKNTLPAEIAEKSATFHGWRGRKDGRQIDYVLLGKGPEHRVVSSAVNRFEKDGRYPSDHYPVTAEVLFP